MRVITLLLVLAAAGCTNSTYHELPHTSQSDPIWQLNEGKWTFNDNTLTTPPPSELQAKPAIDQRVIPVTGP